MTCTGWGLASGLLGLAGYAWYVPVTVRGGADPDPVSWLAWTLLYGVLLAAQACAGARAGLGLPALQAAGTATTCVLAFHRPARRCGGAWRAALRAAWARVGWPDVAACCGVAAALALWPVTSSAAAATVGVVTAEGYGMIRTIVKVWRHPASEPPAFWVLCVAAGLCAIRATTPHPALAVRIYLGFFLITGVSVVAAGCLGSWRPRPCAPGRDLPVPSLADAQRSAPTPPSRRPGRERRP